MGIIDFLKKGKNEPVKQASRPQAVTTPKPASAPQQAKREEYYTVKSGDSLSKIAKQLYGDAGQWQKIFNANKSLISNPDMIHPGQKLVIPR